MRETRQVIRALLKSPGYLAIAVLMLAFGLGVNATLFSLVGAVLLRPLPGIQNAERLVLVGRTSGAPNSPPDVRLGFDTLSYPNFVDMRDQNEVFEDFAARRVIRSSLSVGDRSQIVAGEMVSWNYFRTLRSPLAAGRFFRIEEDTAGTSELAVVISERLWQRLWQRSPAAVGSSVTINGHPFTVVGVVGGGFRGAVLPTEVDLWIPWAFEPVFHPTMNLLESRGSSSFHGVARLKPGVSEAEAQSNLDTIMARLERAYPRENEGKGVRVWQYHPFPSPTGFRAATRFLSILIGVSILVLVVVCANLSNLMLARAIARQREMAIRAAIGASKWQLLRLLFIEGSVLATLGLLASLSISSWAGAALLRFLPGDNGEPVNLAVGPDLYVALAAGALALLCTLLFAALPAWHGTRLDLVPALRSGEAASTPRRLRLRSAALVVQIALCAILLVGAGLLVRSVQSLKEIDPGLNVDRLLLVDLDLELNGYTRERGQRFFAHLRDRLAETEGVAHASFGRVVPLGQGGLGLGGVYGGQVAKDSPAFVDCNIVGLDYLPTLGVELLRGRDFQPSDSGKERRVVVVNETLAKQMWPDGDAVGKPFFLQDEGDERPYEVIGVAANLRYRGLEDVNRPFYYLPMEQFPMLSQTLHIRTHGDPLAMVSVVRDLVREQDPSVALGTVDTMEAVLDKSIGLQRLAATLVGCCGFLGIVIASLGLYGVIAFEVSRQTREIGVRIALGAMAGEVARGVVRHAFRIAVIGLSIGLALSAAAAQFLSSLLYGVQPFDPATYAAVAAILLLTSIVASLVPARRATRIDPIRALRFE